MMKQLFTIREFLWWRICELQERLSDADLLSSVTIDAQLHELLLQWSEQELKRPVLPVENIYY